MTISIQCSESPQKLFTLLGSDSFQKLFTLLGSEPNNYPRDNLKSDML